MTHIGCWPSYVLRVQNAGCFFLFLVFILSSCNVREQDQSMAQSYPYTYSTIIPQDLRLVNNLAFVMIKGSPPYTTDNLYTNEESFSNRFWTTSSSSFSGYVAQEGGLFHFCNVPQNCVGVMGNEKAEVYITFNKEDLPVLLESSERIFKIAVSDFRE